jgi:hypothetical protein
MRKEKLTLWVVVCSNGKLPEGDPDGYRKAWISAHAAKATIDEDGLACGPHRIVKLEVAK